jgi:hypothetical protein
MRNGDVKPLRFSREIKDQIGDPASSVDSRTALVGQAGTTMAGGGGKHTPRHRHRRGDRRGQQRTERRHRAGQPGHRPDGPGHAAECRAVGRSRRRVRVHARSVAKPFPRGQRVQTENLQKILMVALCVGLSGSHFFDAADGFDATQCRACFRQHLTLTMTAGAAQSAFPEIDRGQLPAVVQLLSCCPCSRYLKNVSRPAGSS